MTGTPDRLDGAALGEVFQSVAFSYELREAIRDGWLCRIEVRRIRIAVDLDGDRTGRNLGRVSTPPPVSS